MYLGGLNSVLIIDDKYEEASPVIQALAVNGVSTIYWDGNLESKPESPLKGIRLVILDMRFSTSTDAHIINSILFQYLKSAISDKNGPYILCMWSKHDSEYLVAFKEELPNKADIPQPYLITNLEKNNFIKVIDVKNEVFEEIAASLDEAVDVQAKKEVLQIMQNAGIAENVEKVELIDDVVEKLRDHLNQKFREANSLSILLMWEKIVNLASSKLVNDVSGLSSPGANWDNNIKRLIQQLAAANAGRSLRPTVKEYIVNAMSSLNQMLPDELWKQLQQVAIDEDKYSFIETPSILETEGADIYSLTKYKKNFQIKKNDIDIDGGSFKKISETSGKSCEEIAKRLYNQYKDSLGISNYKLLCESSVLGEMKKPGSVYKVTDQCLLKELSGSIFKDFDEARISDNTLVRLDISSSCDYAQEKLKRIRTLPGILFNDNIAANVEESEDVFKTPTLNIGGKTIRIAFNFQYISSEPFTDLTEENILFSFRELFLIELKHKLSTYISRVGIINL